MHSPVPIRLLALFAWLLAASAPAADFKEVFSGNSLTIHIRELHSGTDHIFNPERARQRFTAFSTFKIPNSIIALETGTVSGPDEVFVFDPERHRSPFRQDPNYNRDQTLPSAFKHSVVWTYQEIATRVGRARYDDYLQTFNPGAGH